MQDRVSLYPGRVKLTPVAGQDNAFDMVRADEPTQEGTKLSKATLLSDEVAILLGGDSSMVPSQAFAILTEKSNQHEQQLSLPKIVFGSYKGTGKYGASNPSSLAFQRRPVRVQIESTGASSKIFFVNELTSSYKVTGYYYRATSGALSGEDAYTSSSYAKFDDATNTLYWYSTRDATGQSNTASTEFLYTAWFE